MYAGSVFFAWQSLHVFLPKLQLNIQLQINTRTELESAGHQPFLIRFVIEPGVEAPRGDDDGRIRVRGKAVVPANVLEAPQIPRQRPVIAIGGDYFDYGV